MPLWSNAHFLFHKMRIKLDPQEHEVMPLSPKRGFCGDTDDFGMIQALKLEHKHATWQVMLKKQGKFYFTSRSKWQLHSKYYAYFVHINSFLPSTEYSGSDFKQSSAFQRESARSCVPKLVITILCSTLAYKKRVIRIHFIK